MKRNQFIKVTLLIALVLVIAVSTVSAAFFKGSSNEKTYITDADSFQVEIANIFSDKVVDTEQYIVENLNEDYAKYEKLEAKDIMWTKNLVAEASLLPEERTIDALWAKNPDAFIVLNDTYTVLYDVDENSEYYVAFANTMKNDATAIVTDAAFAYTNLNGEVIYDAIYDWETGLAYIPKKYTQENKNGQGICNVQIELLQAVNTFSPTTTMNVIVEDKVGIPGKVAKSGKVTVDAVATKFGVRVALNQKAIENIDQNYFKLLVNGTENTDWVYDSNLGAIILNMEPMSVETLEIELSEDNIESNLQRGNGIATIDTFDEMKSYDEVGVWELSSKPADGAFITIKGKEMVTAEYFSADQYPEDEYPSGRVVDGLPLYYEGGTSSWEKNIVDKVMSGNALSDRFFSTQSMIQYEVKFLQDITVTDGDGVEYKIPKSIWNLRCTHGGKTFNSDLGHGGRQGRTSYEVRARVFKSTDSYLLVGMITTETMTQTGAGFYKIHYKVSNGKLNLEKSLDKTDSPYANLENAVYGVYKNQECTDKVGELVTDAQGKSNELSLPKATYYVKETQAPEGCLLDETVYTATVDPGETVTVYAKDNVDYRIKIQKLFEETVGKKGDAKLSGGEYGIYSDNACTQLVTTVTTGSDGYSNVSGQLEYNTYYAKEIRAPEGTRLNDTIYTLDPATAVKTDDGYVATFKVYDALKRGKVQVVKFDQNSDTDEKSPAYGAELKLTLNSNPNEFYTVTVDEIGFAEFFDQDWLDQHPGEEYTIPVGTYTLSETRGSYDGEHTHYFADPETVVIQDEKQETYIILGEEKVRMYLKLSKIDKKYRDVVKIQGAEFMVWDCQKDDWVSQKNLKTGEMQNVFTTNEEGTVILNEKIDAGEYIIYETKAPTGYYKNNEVRLPEKMSDIGVIGKGGMYVNIDKKAMGMEEDELNKRIDLYYECKLPDDELTTILRIYKTGEMLTGATQKTDPEFGEMYIPQFSERPLAGVKYDVIAEEDIMSPDGRTPRYLKGEVVQTIVTGDDGYAETKKLPNGKYRLVEKEAPAGYIISKEDTIVTTNNNTEEETIVKDVNLNNKKQRLTIKVNKMFEDVKYTTRENLQKTATFGVYSNEDIKNCDGIVVIPDEKLVATIDVKDGEVQDTSKLDLPAGKYFVKELKTVVPYMPSDEVKEVTLKYDGNEEPVVEFGTDTFTNVPDTAKVTLIKLSTSVADNLILNGTDVDMAEVDKKVKELIEMFSGMSESEVKEYLTTNKVKFVPGAKYGIFFDEDCTEEVYVVKEDGTKEVAQMVTDDTGMITMGEVPLGTYYFKEITPPQGYELSTEVIKLDLTIENKDAVVYQAIVEEPVKGPGIIKTDAFTGDYVDYCEFVVKDALTDEEIVHSVTGTYKEDTELRELGYGYIPLDKLVNGRTYTFTEIEAPGIYDLNTEPHEFTAHFDENGDWDAEPIEVENRRKTIKGSLTIRKVDDETGEPLEGCKFSIVLLDDNGEPYVNKDGKTIYLVENAVTDKDGEYIIDKVPYGTYKFIEVEAPEGYEKAEEEMENYVFTIDENSSEDIIFEVTNTGDIAVYALSIVALVSILGIIYVAVKNKKIAE